MAFDLGSLDQIVSSVSSQASRVMDVANITNGISGTVNQVVGTVNSIANSVGNVSNEVNRISNALNNLSNPEQLVSSLRSVNLPVGGNPYNYFRPGPESAQYIRYGMNLGTSGPNGVSWGGGGGVSWSGAGSDWRVKLGDLIFPYTPTIAISGMAQWQEDPLIHQNVGFQAFQYSKPETYNIEAPFWVEDEAGAEYWLNARDYLRNCTKMMGPAPPPILCLKGYGGTIDSPVIITTYSVNLSSDVNYISSGGTYVPAKSSFSISVRTIYSVNSPGYY